MLPPHMGLGVCFCVIWASENGVTGAFLRVTGACLSTSRCWSTSWCGSLGLAGAMDVGLESARDVGFCCAIWASMGGVLCEVQIVGGFRGVGLSRVETCGDSHFMRLTGPLLFRLCRSFFLAHSLTLNAA